MKRKKSTIGLQRVITLYRGVGQSPTLPSKIDASKSHESKGDEASGDESNAHSIKPFGNGRVSELFTDRGDEDNGQVPAEPCTKTKNDAWEEWIVSYATKKRCSKDRAVHSNKGKIDTKRSIERGENMLEDHL